MKIMLEETQRWVNLSSVDRRTATTPNQNTKMKIKITERSTGKNLTIHSVNRRDFSDYYVTRQGERGPVFDTDDDEIETAIAAAPTKNPAAVALGSVKSPAKKAASIENGKKGGRPKRDRYTVAKWDRATGAKRSMWSINVGTIAEARSILSGEGFKSTFGNAVKRGMESWDMPPDGDYLEPHATIERID